MPVFSVYCISNGVMPNAKETHVASSEAQISWYKEDFVFALREFVWCFFFGSVRTAHRTYYNYVKTFVLCYKFPALLDRISGSSNPVKSTNRKLHVVLSYRCWLLIHYSREDEYSSLIINLTPAHISFAPTRSKSFAPSSPHLTIYERCLGVESDHVRRTVIIISVSIIAHWLEPASLKRAR